MLKRDIQKKHARVLRDSAQVKEHFKMYKVGKTWLFAGLFTISMGAGLAFGGHQDVYADTATPTETTTQATPQQTDSQTKSAVIGNNTQSQDTASNMKADTSTDTDADSATSTNVATTTDNAATMTASAPENQSAAEQKAPATAETQVKSADVQTTNLGDVTDQSTIDQAKTAAAATYAKTGTPQTITAVAGAEEDPATTADSVHAVTATVENATKTYDNKSDTPATFNVQLSDNLTAPTGWFFTGNENEYQVDAASGDIDLSKVNQNVGSYDITLSNTGLARLNAVQANQTKNLLVSALDVTAGKLTITKAPVVTGSVAIENTSKLYDNDATTDPTSFKVTVSSELKAPTDWTVNADGSYTVTVASGDIKANVDSQEPGTYTVNLTASGLQKLSAANPNYNTVASNVTVGNFQIQNNTKLSIGTVRMKTTDANLPAKVTVSIPRSETVPTDWEKSYDNTGQEDIVYNVPISYFDTSTVNKTTVTSYPLNLTTTALNNLNTANPNTPIKSINIQPGRIIIADGSVNTPKRNLSNFGGGGGNLNNKVLSDGDGATLQLGIFGTSTETIKNLTDVIIIPAGLAVADVTTDSTNPTKITSYTKSDDPVDVIKNSITQTLTTTGTSYTDLTVGQLPDYKGRQAFYFKLGTVTETGDKAKVPLNIVVDPDITNVTTGNFGDRKVENDAAILYATDDNAYTDGAYTIDTGGAYPDMPVVANGLGLTNTETISDTYDNGMWAGTYTIKHIPVQTTYNLKDAAGNIIASAVKTSGTVGDAFDPLTVIPETITAADGTQYILDRTSVPDENTFKKDATAQLQPGDTLATGTNYTAIYKKVIDTTTNQAKIADSEMTWKSATPSTMTVTLPSNLKAPSTWTKTADNTYTVNTSDGDLDLSDVQSPTGSYKVTLSKQGLTKIAAANPDYLFDNSINGVGTLTVNPIKVPVTVKDTAGTTLKENVHIQLGVNDAGTGADAGVDGYPTSQLKSVTFNYAQNDNNTTGVKTATLVADKTAGTITVTTTYYGNKPQSVATMTKEELGGVDAGTALALQLNDGSMGSGVGFNDPTPQITPAQAGTMAALTGIDVVYNQKVTATLVPSDGNGNPIFNTTPTTVTGFPGDSVSVPEVPGYTPTSNVTVPNGPDSTVKVQYTPNTQAAEVQFKDQDGSSLGDAVELTGPSDSSIDYTKALNTQKTLISQGYLPINGDKTGFATAPKTFDRNDKTTQTITVTLSKLNDKVPADAYLVPVDANGNPIKNTTSTTVTGLPGTTVNAPDVPGYTVIDTDKTVTIPTPVPTLDKNTGKVPTSDKRGTTVKITYIANNQTVKVQFVDQDGNKLGDATELTGGSDSNINYTPALNAQKALISQGYLPIDGDKTGFAVAPKVFDHDGKNTPTITVKLTKITPISADTTLVPVDKDGNPIPNTTSTTVTGIPGTNVTVPDVQGYTPEKGKTVSIPTPVPTIDKDTGKVVTPDKRGTTVNVVYTPNTVTVTVKVPSNKGYQDVPNVTGQTGDHINVTVPNVPGYTPNKTTVPATVNPNGSITVDNPTSTGLVTYSPDQQKMIVTVGNKTYTTTGPSDSPITYDENSILSLIPTGYDLAGFNSGDFSKFLTDNHVKTTFDHDDNTDQTWTVPLVQKVDYETATTTRTIHFVGDNGKTLAPDQVQDVTYVRPVTAVSRTPLDLFSPMGWYTEFTAPTVSGYTIKAGNGYTVENDTGTVSASDPMITDLPKNAKDITVYYTANAQSVQVKYVDDNNNGATVGTPKTLSGVTDGSAVWDTTDKPAGYDLADKQATSGSYTFTAESNQTVTIHLTHHISTETITATRTITFKGNQNSGVDESKLPSTIVQKVNWTISTDEATGEVTFTPDGNSNYQAVPLHSIPSGNAEITYVPEFTYVTAWNPVEFTATKDDLTKLGNPDLGKDSTFLNADETYYYNAIGVPETGAQGHFKDQVPDAPSANQYTINFVTPNGDVIGHMPFIGNPGDKVNVSTNIPKGYVLTPGNDGIVTVPNKQDPKTPIIFNVTTPAGQDADGAQVWTKSQVPDAPSANQYTINFVTPNGDVIGHMPFIGNPGDNLNVTPSIPKGYVPTPGKNGDITITDTDEPDKPIVFNVTTPAGQDTDGIQSWFKAGVPDAPYANQYTVNFVTSGGNVVGTATVVGNPGNNFNVTGNVPNGYTLVDGADGVVEISKNQNPAQPIPVDVKTTVPSGNGGTPPTGNGAGVPGGTSTETGTGMPTGNQNTTTDGPGAHTQAVDQPNNHTVTNDNTDNNTTTTEKNSNTVGQSTSQSSSSNVTNNGMQTGLVQQSGNAEAGQAQQVTGTNGDNANTASSNTTKSKAATLPQTNEQQSSSVWATIGLSLMSMLSLLGITKKKREDEK